MKNFMLEARKNLFTKIKLLNNTNRWVTILVTIFKKHFKRFAMKKPYGSSYENIGICLCYVFLSDEAAESHHVMS